MSEERSGANQRPEMITESWSEPKTSARPRVCVLSDVRLLREGVTSCMSGCRSIDIVGAVTSAEPIAAITSMGPDVVLLDLAARDSLLLPRRLIALLPSLRVVAFAVVEAEVNIPACAKAGICGYVAQDGSIDDLVGAVLSAMEGKVVCSPQIAAALFRRVAALSSGVPAQTSERLSARELEITDLVMRGLTNKTIARELRLAPATVKNHVHNILQKLDLSCRGEIAMRHRTIWSDLPSS